MVPLHKIRNYLDRSQDNDRESLGKHRRSKPHRMPEALVKKHGKLALHADAVVIFWVIGVKLSNASSS